MKDQIKVEGEFKMKKKRKIGESKRVQKSLSEKKSKNKKQKRNCFRDGYSALAQKQTWTLNKRLNTVRLLKL